MDNIRINQLAIFLGFLYTIWLTYKILKRARVGKDEAIGCASVGYIYLIVVTISGLAIGGTISLSTMMVNKAQTFYSGSKYDAYVVSYTSFDKRNSDDNGYTIMYTPTVQFRTAAGDQMEYELDYSTSSKPKEGERYTLYYDDVNERVTTFGIGVLALMLASCVMITILLFLFVGMMIYAMNWSMARYKEVGAFLGLVIIVPLLMVLFEGVMIYALFNGEDKPIWVYVVLVFFIVVLAMGIWGYMRSIAANKITNTAKHEKGKQWVGTKKDKRIASKNRN